jgi:hypothetical protein
MKRKHQPSRTAPYLWGQSVKTYPPGESDTDSYQKYVNYGSDTIEYAEGPQWIDGRCNWKACRHDTRLQRSGFVGKASWLHREVDTWDGSVRNAWQCVETNRATLNDPGGTSSGVDWPTFNRSALNQCLAQLDLNCRESVLLYSGIIQAVPLVGGCFRFLSIMNNLAKKLKKGMLTQPFTTVVKSAISLDFIDRFVLSPTIDDARRFLDSTNYVLRVIETAYTRNAAPTALSGSVKNTTWQKSTDGLTLLGCFTGGNTTYRRHDERYSASKAWLLLDVNYDVRAIDPIKLWATRAGLTRPLDSAWDLVPFSFVIDYFTRAGDFISQLQDKVTDQDGLCGKISNIRGAWYACENTHITECIGLSQSFPSNSQTGTWRQEYTNKVSELSTETIRTSKYVRAPIPAYEVLSGVQADPSGLFHVDLSLTRLRTLAELVIQAKL